MLKNREEKKRQIIEEYNKTKIVHPSLMDIAIKTKTTKSFVFRIVKEYLTSLKKSTKSK